MNELEEKEALESLRSITPTKEILDSVVQDGSEVSKVMRSTNLHRYYGKIYYKV